MELTWYGTASLVLREGESTIAFDPFDGIALGELKHPPAALPREEVFRRVEHVFVTHGHFDHIYDLPRLYAGTSTRIYCTATPARTLTQRGLSPGQLEIIAPGWQGEVGPFTIRALHGSHCRFDLPLVGKTVCSRRFFRHPGHTLRLLELVRECPEAGEILFYEVTCRGLRVQIMGSMGLDPQVDYPTGADLLVLALQGRSDQDAYALELARRLSPRAVCIDHWDDTFAPLTSAVDVSGFVRRVGEELHIPCLVPDQGRPFLLEETSRGR